MYKQYAHENDACGMVCIGLRMFTFSPCLQWKQWVWLNPSVPFPLPPSPLLHPQGHSSFAVQSGMCMTYKVLSMNWSMLCFRYHSGTKQLLNYLLFGYCDLSADSLGWVWIQECPRMTVWGCCMFIFLHGLSNPVSQNPRMCLWMLPAIVLSFFTCTRVCMESFDSIFLTHVKFKVGKFV